MDGDRDDHNSGGSFVVQVNTNILPLAQARAPPLGNCASGPVNLLLFLTDKVAIMGMFVPVIYNCFPCAVSRLTPSDSSPFVPFCIPPQLKSAVAIWVRVIFLIVFRCQYSPAGI